MRGLSAAGSEVFAFLRRTGASFFADIVRGTGRLKSEVETALWELVAAGVVTADGFDNLRALIDPRRRAGHGPGRHTRPQPQRGAVVAATRGARRGSSVQRCCTPPVGCCCAATAWSFANCLAREDRAAEMARAPHDPFRQLEDRGEIRGGRFVSGFIGEQFALPLAGRVASGGAPFGDWGDLVTVSAADPLKPRRHSRARRIAWRPNSGRFVTFRDGVALAIEPDARLGTQAAS